MVSVKLRQLYPRYQLEMKLGAPPGNRTPILWLCSLYRLSSPKFRKQRTEGRADV
jgi:hypothetical protein